MPVAGHVPVTPTRTAMRRNSRWALRRTMADRRARPGTSTTSGHRIADVTTESDPPPQRIGEPGDGARMLPHPGIQSHDRQPHELAGGRLRPRAQATAVEEIARRRSPRQLAARGLRHTAGRHQQNLLGWCIEQPRRRFADPLPQHGQRIGFGQSGFRHHDKLLGAGTRVGRSEDGDAALANALEIADRRLDLLRIDMGPDQRG